MILLDVLGFLFILIGVFGSIIVGIWFNPYVGIAIFPTGVGLGIYISIISSN